MTNLNNTLFISVVLCSITLALGISSIAVHSQYKNASDQREKKIKRQRRNKLFISFCFFLVTCFIWRVAISKTFKWNSRTRDKASSMVTSKYLSSEQTGVKLPKKEKLSENKSEICDIKLTNLDGKCRNVNLFRACCKGDSYRPTEFMIYSPPKNYEYVLEVNTNNSQHDKPSSLLTTNRNENFRYLKYGKDNIWQRALHITGLKKNGINIPILRKSGDIENYYIPKVDALGVSNVRDRDMFKLNRNLLNDFDSSSFEEYIQQNLQKLDNTSTIKAFSSSQHPSHTSTITPTPTQQQNFDVLYRQAKSAKACYFDVS